MEGRYKNMKLNYNQVIYLFMKGYLDSKTLDSPMFSNFATYWADNYEFKLDTKLNYWGMRTLKIIDKQLKDICHKIYLNFQGNDFKDFLQIK